MVIMLGTHHSLEDTLTHDTYALVHTHMIDVHIHTHEGGYKVDAYTHCTHTHTQVMEKLS